MAASDLLMQIRLLVSGNGSNEFSKISREVKSLSSSIAGLKSAAKYALTFLGADKIADSFIEANKSLESFTRTFNSIKGAGQGFLEFEALYKIAQTNGLAISSLTQSFQQLNAATLTTSLEGFKTERLFEAVSKAMSVLGADTVRTHRAFLALSQIMSKGQLYAEELRQQLGEAMPDAIQLFAKAANLSTKDFLKNVQNGVYQGKELANIIVAWTSEVENRYSSAAGKTTTFEMAQNRLANSFYKLNTEIGKTGLWSLLINSLTNLSNYITKVSNDVEGSAISFKVWRDSISSLFDEIDNRAGNIPSFTLDKIFDSSNLNPGQGVRNYASFFQLLEGELRYSLQPIEDALANFDMTKALKDTIPNIVAIIQVISVYFNDLVNKFSIGSDILSGAFSIAWLNIKVGFFDTINDLMIKFKEFELSVVSSKFNVRASALFGTFDEVYNNIIKLQLEIENLKQGLDASGEGGQSSLEGYKKALEDASIAFKKLVKDSSGSVDRGTSLRNEEIDAIFEQLEAQKRLRDENTRIALSLREIDKEEQRLWAYRVQNLRATKDESAAASELSKVQIKSLKTQSDLRLKLLDSINKVRISQIKNSREEYAGQREVLIAMEQSSQLYQYLQLSKEQDAKIADAKSAEEVTAQAEIKKKLLEKIAAINEEKNDVYALKKTYEELAKTQEIIDTGKKSVTAKVDADISDAQKTYTTKFVEWVANPENAAKAQLNMEQPKTEFSNFSDKINSTVLTPIIRPIYDSSGIPSYSNVPPDKKRWGGFIGGYGGGDRIRALLEPGEFVMRKEAVRALGIEQLYRLNRLGSQAKSSLLNNLSIPRFANGGGVSGQPIIINVPGSKAIALSGSRDAALQLANLLTRTGRAL